MEQIWTELYHAAKAVQRNRQVSSYVEAGGVAAAIQTASGRIYTGVCVDTCSTLGICAERNAIFNMLTNGETKITRVLAVMGSGRTGAPCGACRELMVQLMPNAYQDIEIMLDYETGRIVTLGELTPEWWICGGSAESETRSEELQPPGMEPIEKKGGTEMEIAERIIQLRKRNGFSQEQLADSIGVTRQAVSKWEREQNAPDLDKIILLSDFFHVTTDYLLKGIELGMDSQRKPDSRIFSAVGTAVNLIGILLAVMLWIARKAAYASFFGLAILAVGCAVIAVGHFLGNQEGFRQCALFNVWIVLLIPISIVSNVARGLLEGYYPLLAPIPMLGNSHLLFLLGIALYAAVCLTVDWMILQKSRQSDRDE